MYRICTIYVSKIYVQIRFDWLKFFIIDKNKKICLRIFHSYREEYGLESELIIVNVISDESKRE